jgi:hypothetical protein
MSEEECDLEALLDVLDEDDIPDGDDHGVESDSGNGAGLIDSNGEPNNEPSESNNEEEDEEEIQRQLLEMEAKMRAIKEKLNKKHKSPAAAAKQPASQPAKSTVTAVPRASVAVSEIDVFRNSKSCISGFENYISFFFLFSLFIMA